MRYLSLLFLLLVGCVDEEAFTRHAKIVGETPITVRIEYVMPEDTVSSDSPVPRWIKLQDNIYVYTHDHEIEPVDVVTNTEYARQTIDLLIALVPLQGEPTLAMMIEQFNSAGRDYMDVFFENWMQRATEGLVHCDLNGDGIVDLEDFVLLSEASWPSLSL